MSESKNYILNNSKIVLTSEAESLIGHIANAFFQKTNRKLRITSGKRSPESQVQAMIAKLKGGDDLSVYANKAAITALKKAYREKGKQGMLDLLRWQIDKGILISRHLGGKAVDIRSIGVSQANEKILREICKDYAVKIIKETIPPHFHLEW